MKNLNNLEIILGDMNNEKEIDDIIHILECYKNDKMGESPPYRTEEKIRLKEQFKSSKNCLVFLAYLDGVLTGGSVCFNTFSTFSSRDVINIHDICIIEEFKGLGIGKALMNRILSESIGLDCSKITLEVREDNLVAQNLYKSLGFKESTPNMLFWSKPL